MTRLLAPLSLVSRCSQGASIFGITKLINPGLKEYETGHKLQKKKKEIIALFRLTKTRMTVSRDI